MTLDSARINWGKLAKRILLYFVVSLICIIILYPYFVMFLTALKSREEIFSPNGTIFPQVWHWNNFTEIFKRAPMAQYMLNSIIIASGSTAIAMICGIPAAYALARMKFKGQTAFLGFIIVSQMFAPVVLLIGIYKVMQTMALTNTLLGLIFIMPPSTRHLPSGCCVVPSCPSPLRWSRPPPSTAATVFRPCSRSCCPWQLPVSSPP